MLTRLVRRRAPEVAVAFQPFVEALSTGLMVPASTLWSMLPFVALMCSVTFNLVCLCDEAEPLHGRKRAVSMAEVELRWWVGPPCNGSSCP